MSLDGYIAGPKGEADWIPMDPEVNFVEIWSRFDILLMGRRTYETAREGFEKFGTQGNKIAVVSRTLRAEDHPGLKILSELGPESVADLRGEAKKDIWLFGGGSCFARFSAWERWIVLRFPSCRFCWGKVFNCYRVKVRERA